MVSLILLIISVISISCAYIIQYKSPILGNLGQALPEHFVAILLIFTLIFSVAGIIMCFVEQKKETRHWSIVVCEGYCIQCSFSILDRGSRYRNFLGIIVSQLMVILTYVEIKEIRVL